MPEIPQAAGRQPGRDRHPGLPLGPRAGHPHRRHLLARGPLRACTGSRPTRRTPSASRASRSAATSTSRRSSPWRRRRRSTRSTPATASSPRTPPSPAPARRPGSPWSAPGPSCSTCSATRSPPGSWPSRPACRSSAAAASRSSRGPRRVELAEAMGYPVIVKAVDGRRRPGDAGRRGARLARRGARPGPPRGADRLRLPRRLPREVHPPGQAHRGPAPRRPARQPRPPATSATARSSGGTRRSSRSPRPTTSTRRSATPSATPRSSSAGTAATTTPGTVEFLVDVDDEQVLLHRGQPAHPGRAHRHRDGHRRRPGQEPDPRRRRACRSRTPRSACPTSRPSRSTGYAFQCRITTEDPENNFTPDYGRITHYRSPGGLGLRLDSGTAITGAIVTPFYDSLLVKVSAQGRRFVDAVSRMERALAGVPHPGREDEHPVPAERHRPPRLPRRPLHHPVHRPDARAVPLPQVRLDRATRLLTFMRPRSTVNGFPDVNAARPATSPRPSPSRPPTTTRPPARGLAAALQGARRREVLRAGSASRTACC